MLALGRLRVLDRLGLAGELHGVVVRRGATPGTHGVILGTHGGTGHHGKLLECRPVHSDEADLLHTEDLLGGDVVRGEEDPVGLLAAREEAVQMGLFLASPKSKRQNGRM